MHALMHPMQPPMHAPMRPMQDAVLDFFGSPVKAQELLVHVSQMRFLSRVVEGQEAAAKARADTVMNFHTRFNWTSMHAMNTCTVPCKDM